MFGDPEGSQHSPLQSAPLLDPTTTVPSHSGASSTDPSPGTTRLALRASPICGDTQSIMSATIAKVTASESLPANLASCPFAREEGSFAGEGRGM